MLKKKKENKTTTKNLFNLIDVQRKCGKNEESYKRNNTFFVFGTLSFIFLHPVLV